MSDRGDRVKFNGIGGTNYMKFKDKFRVHLVSNVLARKLESDQVFLVLQCEIEYALDSTSGSGRWWESVKDDIMSKTLNPTDPGYTAGATAPTAATAGTVLDRFWAAMDAKYKKPTASDITAFYDLKQEDGEEVATYGSRFMLYLDIVQQQMTSTLPPVSQFTKGLLPELFDRVSWHMATLPTEKQTVETAIEVASAQYESIKRDMLADASAGGRRKGKQGSSGGAGGRESGGPNATKDGAPAKGKPNGKWCTYHLTSSHDSSQCIQLKRRQQQLGSGGPPVSANVHKADQFTQGMQGLQQFVNAFINQGVPRSNNAKVNPNVKFNAGGRSSGPGPSQYTGPACTTCGSDRHSVGNCYIEHPELAPPHYKGPRRPDLHQKWLLNRGVTQLALANPVYQQAMPQATMQQNMLPSAPPLANHNVQHPVNQQAQQIQALLDGLQQEFHDPSSSTRTNVVHVQHWLLMQSLIDHRRTAPNNPQADGLAERAVQSVKASLAKMCEKLSNIAEWEEQLAWVALGYRCSKQASTGFSPYEMLFARKPVVPPAIFERMTEPIDFDDTETAASLLVERAESVKRMTVMAGDNLKIAQHRDTLRYATLRGGGYSPQLRKYEVGDYVYVRTAKKADTLKLTAKPVILRIVKLSGSTATLQGRCGRTVTNNIVNLAPCHLPNIKHEINVELARPSKQLSCEICSFPDDESLMLLCDECGLGFHTFCLNPPLKAIPAGNWYCDNCNSQRDTPAPDSTKPMSAAQQLALHKAEKLDGAKVLRKVRERGSRMFTTLWGELVFRGAEHYPDMLLAFWDDGTVEPVKPKAAEQMVLHAQDIASVATVQAITDMHALPATWNLSDASVLHSVLQMFMPGHWDKAHITKLSQNMPGGTKFLNVRNSPNPGVPACVATGEKELTPLLQCTRFSPSYVFLDPWSGTGGISSVLASLGYTVITNDINPDTPADLHQDALQPAFYQKLLKVTPVDVIILSPWFAFLDVAIPLAVLAASVCVCVHIPGHYFTNAVMPRYAYLKPYFQLDSAHFVWGLPRGPMGMRCAWLLLFKTPKHKHAVLRKEYLVSSTMSLP